MSAIPVNLNDILNQAEQNRAQNLRTLAVFDLDSTLFNVSTRTQKILHEFAEAHKLDHLKDVVILPEDWGLKEALFRKGYTVEKDLEMLQAIRDFWAERFFSSEYLHFDVPYPGAVCFVQDLKEAGCEINYLTGRDYVRMGKGSFEVLKKWGFPVTDENLFLKPEKSQDDELFKHDWFKKLNHSDYKKIFFFENEPVNVNAILQSCPEVEVIYLDTTHSRKQTVTAELKRIKHFGRS
ncbi:MAG: hypothetical protein K0R29_325 [Pseudobdellovibrio sp.]|jgi:hypothetical protein|nr:hypothetical protein [Pseudobdellovibrio sp.]